MSGWGVTHGVELVASGLDAVAAAWLAYRNEDCHLVRFMDGGGWTQVPLTHPQARCVVCGGFATTALEVDLPDGRWSRMTCDDPGCRWDAGRPLSERPLTVSEAEAITGDLMPAAPGVEAGAA